MNLDEIEARESSEDVYDLVERVRDLVACLRDIENLCLYNRHTHDDILPLVKSILEYEDGE